MITVIGGPRRALRALARAQACAQALRATVLGCPGRALARAQALRASAEEARSMEESSMAAPSEIVVTGVVIATAAPSAQATLISSEGAVIYEIAPAVVIRGPL